MKVTYSEHSRKGDHIWYISDTRKFQRHYPAWKQEYDLERIIGEIYEAMLERVIAHGISPRISTIAGRPHIE